MISPSMSRSRLPHYRHSFLGYLELDVARHEACRCTEESFAQNDDSATGGQLQGGHSSSHLSDDQNGRASSGDHAHLPHESTFGGCSFLSNTEQKGSTVGLGHPLPSVRIPAPFIVPNQTPRSCYSKGFQAGCCTGKRSFGASRRFLPRRQCQGVPIPYLKEAET